MFNASRHNARDARGFTLIELMVVTLIIGLVAAVSIPRMIPLIAFTALEGNARRLANYGRAATAQATFKGERHVVRFELDAEPQCYYMVYWAVPEDADVDAGAEQDPFGLESMLDSAAGAEDDPYVALAAAFPGMQRKVEEYTDEDIDLYLLNRGIDPALLEAEDVDQIRVKMALDDEFDTFHRKRLEARAANVIPPEGIMDAMGPLFGEEDDFDLDEAEPEEVEVKGPVLRRHFMPADVRISSVSVDGEREARGVVEIEVSALGLAQYVEVELVSVDGEWYTVIWDPALGLTKWHSGTVDR